ncbi:MAG: outer membrane insertion C- signal, partial [Bacteroidetes bacterium]|nr:outer membrane insertion C- signal [Bacteroidota bacterium]
MKTLRLIVAVSFLMMLVSSPLFAQEGGIRFGDALGNKSSVAVDAVFSLGKYSRIHADASFGNGVGIEALYDFLYRPLSDSPFNWYLGAGPSLYLGDPFLLGVAGEAGLEYRFKGVPLVLGADYRPTFVIVQNTDFSGGFGF